MNIRPERNLEEYKILHREKSRSHYERNKQYYFERNQKKVAEKRAFLSRYKEESGCKDCGKSYPGVAMDFDHRNPSEKDNGISELANFGWGRIKREIEKCDVRCAVCHRIRHWEIAKLGKASDSESEDS